jgi:hypothetical protein
VTFSDDGNALYKSSSWIKNYAFTFSLPNVIAQRSSFKPFVIFGSLIYLLGKAQPARPHVAGLGAEICVGQGKPIRADKSNLVGLEKGNIEKEVIFRNHSFG